VVPSVALRTDAGASGVLLERAAELSMLVDRLEAVRLALTRQDA
jgi:hypothetical protein